MNQTSLQRIDGFLDSSTRELFLSHGMTVYPCSPQAAGGGQPLTATIGFTSAGSADFRGQLVLTLNRDLAVGSLPPNLRKGEAGDEIVADWAGELSNQLLGRLKNRFHPTGVDIALSTPVVFMGRGMRHFCCASSIQRTLGYAEGRIVVELQVSYDGDLEIPEGKESLEPSQPEGEAVFF